MHNHLIRKLDNFTRLSPDDRDALSALTRQRVRRFAARDDIIREGEPPRELYMMLTGWAYRYKMLEDGRRQILAFFLPGDTCDLNNPLLREMDHSIGALTALTVAEVSQRALDELSASCPRVGHAMWWETLVNIAIQREWTVNLGQRTAIERLAHLLVELFLRLRSVGLADDESCQMPATQTDLADATGLTAVHVNRTLQDMRARGLIRLKGGMLTIPDLEALKSLAMYNPNYLHLGREGGRFDSNE